MASTIPLSGKGILEYLAKNASITVPIIVVAVLATIVLPLPSYILDIFIAINLTFAVVIVLMSMYVDSPANFTIFPSMILITTLYRLALNVASTRLILSQGAEGTSAAGKIIESFGTLVARGDPVIGAIIFLLIVIIQMVVIAQGSVRIGEVSARFTLDAMPGKQMAIDADLNAGFIDEHEARKRREQITQEASFFGAMDGAVRFTRRDAIASLIITFINIGGGLIIGMINFDMPLGTALRTYTILTIGDGLVSAIPSLIIAVAAGLMVTRGASKEDLGSEVIKQLYFDFRPLMISAVLLTVFGIFLPPARWVFFALAATMGFLAYKKFNSVRNAEIEAKEKEAEKARVPPPPERVENLLTLDPLGLEVGYNLIPLVDINQGGNILDRIKGIRRQLALELGVIVPPIRIRDNLQLESNEYLILLRGTEIARGTLMMNHLLAMSPGHVESEVDGVATRDPAFGLPARWIPESLKEQAQISGYTVVDTATVISTHLTEAIKNNAWRLLGRQEVQALVDLVAERAPKLVEDLVPKTITLGTVQKVLQNLLRERVSVRDMQTIIETLGDFAPGLRDFTQLSEYVRMALGRTVVQPYLTKSNELSVLTLTPQLEAQIINSIQHTDQGAYMAMEPHQVQQFLEKLRQAVEIAVFPIQPVLLVSGEIRVHIARLTERFMPGLTVLGHGEVPTNISIINLGIVG